MGIQRLVLGTATVCVIEFKTQNSSPNTQNLTRVYPDPNISASVFLSVTRSISYGGAFSRNASFGFMLQSTKLPSEVQNRSCLELKCVETPTIFLTCRIRAGIEYVVRQKTRTLDGRIMITKKRIHFLCVSVSILFILSCAGCGRGNSAKRYSIWRVIDRPEKTFECVGVADGWAVQILREDIVCVGAECMSRDTARNNDSSTSGGLIAVQFPPQEQESETVDPRVRKPLFPAYYYFANASPLWRLTGHYPAVQHNKAILQSPDPVETDPPDAADHCDRGCAHAEEGQYDRAISDYSKAIEMDPKFARAFYDRGAAYYRKGQHNLAISDYARAIEIDPQLRKQDDLFVRMIRKKWASFKES